MIFAGNHSRQKNIREFVRCAVKVTVGVLNRVAELSENFTQGEISQTDLAFGNPA